MLIMMCIDCYASSTFFLATKGSWVYVKLKFHFKSCASRLAVFDPESEDAARDHPVLDAPVRPEPRGRLGEQGHLRVLPGVHVRDDHPCDRLHAPPPHACELGFFVHKCRVVTAQGKWRQKKNTRNLPPKHRDNFEALKIKRYFRVMVGCSYNLLTFWSKCWVSGQSSSRITFCNRLHCICDCTLEDNSSTYICQQDSVIRCYILKLKKPPRNLREFLFDRSVATLKCFKIEGISCNWAMLYNAWGEKTQCFVEGLFTCNEKHSVIIFGLHGNKWSCPHLPVSFHLST